MTTYRHHPRTPPLASRGMHWWATVSREIDFNALISNNLQVLDFVVTDGVRYDTGPEGLFYHALVTHVREADKAGNIVTYRQEPDGTLIKTGVIEKVDPQVNRLWDSLSTDRLSFRRFVQAMTLLSTIRSCRTVQALASLGEIAAKSACGQSAVESGTAVLTGA